MIQGLFGSKAVVAPPELSDEAMAGRRRGRHLEDKAKTTKNPRKWVLVPRKAPRGIDNKAMLKKRGITGHQGTDFLDLFWWRVCDCATLFKKD